MYGRNHFCRAKGKGEGAADISHQDREPGGTEYGICQINRTADGSAGTLGDGFCVPGVITVSMGYKDKIRIEIQGRGGSQAVAGEKGIRKYLMGSVLQ